MGDPTAVPPRPWRCLVFGCTVMIEDDEVAYCPYHRRLADDGVPAVDLPRFQVADGRSD